ncbi:YmaF family protein [Metabacillus sp. Hm71]|uniref:YmaF family protein n=1 Tax=Metabacillus sp. Hm71 TaxID=3450743 RepID=UPI003F42B52B
MDFIIGAVKPHHAHLFTAKTTVSKKHFHTITGFTRPVNGNSLDRHFHLYRGVTSYDNKHFHRFYGKTGPAIPLPDGSHYHMFAGETYVNFDEPLKIILGEQEEMDAFYPKHNHRFSGKTSDIVGEDPFINGKSIMNKSSGCK